MADDIDSQKEQIKLDLAKTLLKTIPNIPDSFHELSQEEQNRLFKQIDERAARISELLDGKRTGRGPARNPRGPRTTERFSTPQLDTDVRPRKARRITEDE